MVAVANTTIQITVEIFSELICTNKWNKKKKKQVNQMNWIQEPLILNILWYKSPTSIVCNSKHIKQKQNKSVE